jgi:glycosyltransferase involved in cell wall biosynthesis
MRVLLDCRMASWSGVGRYTTGLARALARRDDIELVQFVRRGDLPPIAPEDPEGLTADVIAGPGHPFTPRGGWAFATAVGEIGPDVVHAAHFPTPIPDKHPLVVTLHDLTPMVYPSVMPSPFSRAAYRWWNRRAAHVADVITANSRATAADVERLLPASVGKVRVVLHAPDDDLASQPAEPLPDDVVGWLGSAPYLLSMGNTKPNKDLPTLLAAFQIATGSGAAAAGRGGEPRPEGLEDLRLLLVGEEVPAYVAGWLTDPEVARRARFTGRVTDGQLRTLYEGARAFVFPSVYEGFGLPPLEAMTFGTPVVVADAASLPEVVGDAAVRFAPGDPRALRESLLRVLGDATLAADLVARGKERAASFSWARTAQETVAAYHDAIAAAAERA